MTYQGIRKASSLTQLGGAHRRVVGRVAEKDSPGSVDVIMELDVACNSIKLSTMRVCRKRPRNVGRAGSGVLPRLVSASKSGTISVSSTIVASLSVSAHRSDRWPG